MSSIAVPESEYEAISDGCGLVDRSERGKLSLTGGDAKSFLQGQVSNDVEALTPGRGCYAAFLTPKGKMLGDLRILDAGRQPADEPDAGLVDPGNDGVQLLLLDTERVALQELFNMIRRFRIGYDAELHKRTLQQGLLSLLGPEAASVCGIDPGAAEHSHVADEIGGIPVRAVRTDLGIDIFCRADDTGVLTTALRGRGRDAGDGGDGGRGPHRTGPPALRRRSRRQRDSPGGRPQRPSGVVHQGLLRRAGDGRAPLLPRQAQPPPARTAAVGAGTDRRRDQLRRAHRGHGSGASPSRRRWAAVALALVRREAPPGSPVTVGPDEIKAVVVELPFER